MKEVRCSSRVRAFLQLAVVEKEMERIGVVSIIGVGLIGGSFGLALRKRKLVRKVMGVGRHIHRLREAKELGAIDAYTTDFAQGVKDSDIVVVAAPVSRIPSIVKKILPHLKDSCIVTDVGSTKRWVVRKVEEILSSSGEKGRKVYFVGGHPMAGSEKEGVRNARADIFTGTTCVLTPTEKNRPREVKLIGSLWNSIGARILLLRPEEHDRIVAYTSHLPHVLAASLVNMIGKVSKGKARAGKVIAGSISDMTRIAASNPQMWVDICLSNSKEISDSIKEMIRYLEKFRNSIEKRRKKEVLQLFRKGKIARIELFGQKS